MVRTNSTMLPLGTALPVFDLPVVPGRSRTGIDFLEDKGLARINNGSLLKKPLLIMVICAHCPFVKHIEDGLTSLANDFADQVQILAVSSNSLITHPQDGPDHLAKQAAQKGWQFPYLLDADQSFAKALRAACTPDFFLFSCFQNGEHHLQYRGQLDGSRPGNEVPVTGKDLRAAIAAVLAGQMVPKDQKPSIGCNIKWHPGNEPSWFG